MWLARRQSLHARARALPAQLHVFGLEQSHSLVMLLVPWKRLILGPPFLFQISNDVQPRCRSRLITPKFARLLNACKVMA
jgi:hypothetical protein